MRTILFRGKRIDNGEWVEGDLITKENPPHILTTSNHGFHVDPSTVGQYTGIKDKNGKKIFEGDLLEKPDEGFKGIMGFEGSSFKIIGTDILQKAYWEITGNIHDKPKQ